MSGSPDGAASSAEELFAEYLALVGSGDPVDFDALCRDYLDQAADLRRLKAARDALHERLLEARPRVEDVPHVSVIERLRQEFGSDVDPGKSIQESDSSGSAFAKELISHLGRRSSSFGRYTVDEEIGRGGMGMVLRVWDKDLRRWLAMKLVRARRAGGPPQAEAVGTRTLGRFLEEAQVTSQLDHPGIVPVHELGLDSEGRVYFTMKLVEGRTLQAVFDELARQEGGWTQTRVLGLILKVCEAMSYAHDKGVIHRDLKPSNVMVGRFGEVYVMDWGLARVLNREDRKDLHLRPPDLEGSGASGPSIESPLTMDGDVLGTPAYMPPEQARGEIDRLDKRGDVYALGAMLYQLLTGQVPYVRAGERPPGHALVARVLAGPPLPLATLRRDLPAELAAICDMAMARDPADRYGDMVALAADLRAFLEGRVVRAHRTGALAEFGKWVARNRGMAAAIGAAVLLALGGLAAIALVQANGKAQELRRSYVANLRAAESSLQASECAETLHRLKQADESLREWEWYHLQLASDTSFAKLDTRSARLHGENLEILSVAFTPDGRVFLGDQAGTVRVWDTSSPAQEIGRHSSVYGVAVRADGRLAASGGDDNRLRLWDVHTGKPLGAYWGHTRGLLSVAFSQDGAWIASGSDDNTVCLWDTQTFKSCSLGEHAAYVACVAFDPKGTRVASASGDGTVRLWSVPDGALLAELRGHTAAVRSVAFSPDGLRLASASDDGLVRTWDARTFEALLILRGHTAPVRSVAYGPDGTWIVSGSEDRTVRTWNAGTAELLAIHRGHDATVRSVACSADGQVIASASYDGTVRLWNPRARDCSLIGDGEVSSIAFSPDGTRIIAVSRGVLRVRDAVTGTRLPPFGSVRIVALQAAPTPDGRFFVSSGPDPAVRIWSASTGDLLQELKHGPIFALAQDSPLLATGTDEGEVLIWRLPQGTDRNAKLLRDLPGQGGRVFSLAFDPSGSRVATGLFGAIRVYDVRTGDEHARLSHEGNVGTLAFDPTGRRLASGSDDRTVRVWDPAKGTCLKVLEGHTLGVSAVAWNRSGSRLVSCSPDCTVRVWAASQNARVFEAVAILRGHEKSVACLAFDRDGKRLASGAREGIRIWESSPIAEGPWSENPTRTSADLFPEAEVESADPAELIASAWEVVRVPGNSALAYEKARHRAEVAEKTAVEIKVSQPSDYVPRPLLLRGAAHYRSGDFERACELLTQALELDGDNPVVLAFLAMTHHRLSDEGPAREFLDRLQRMMAARPPQSDWGGQYDLRDLACEAGVLLGR